MTHTPHPLDILFLTNFSDYCFRAIPSIAQMADSLSVRLTLMHVYDARETNAKEAEDKLGSFFPEADRYRSCLRVAAPGPVVDAVKRHLDVWPVNLIVAPASDPIGMPRIGERSLRARLINECGVPVWTIGRRVRVPKLQKPVKNVACWLDFNSYGAQHLPFAMEYAHRVGANLHLLRALPAIHEGSLVHGLSKNHSLHPDGASSEIAQLCSGSPVRPHIHVAHGEGRRTLCKMLNECDADLVFLRNDDWFLTRWLGLGLRLGNFVPCPCVYIGDRLSVPLWNLERGPGTRALLQVRGRNNVRGRQVVAAGRNGSPPRIAEIDLA